MTNHQLTLRSAGVGKKNSLGYIYSASGEAVDSLASVNEKSRGFRDAKEVRRSTPTHTTPTHT